MANAVDAAVDEGKVVDEYFSFIYEEPTDDAFSSHSSEKEELNDFVFDERATIQSTKNEEDPIYQNATLRDAAYWEGVNGDARVNGKSKDEECHTTTLTQTGAAGVIPKEPGAQNFSSSVFKEASNGVEAERLKPDQVTGVNQSCGDGDIITPSVSINVTPSLLTGNTTALTPSHNSSTTYIGNGGNDAGGGSGGKSVINLSAAHLPTTSTSRPKVLKDLESEPPPHHDNQEDFQAVQAPSSSSVGSQSIYVNGGGEERDNTWNAKATSVYLNGTEEESVKEFPVPGGVVPPPDTNAHVTIKVSVNASPSFPPLLGNHEEQTSGVMDPDFGKFLEEMQQPPKVAVGGRERGDGASLRDARPGSASVCRVNKSSDVSELDKSAFCGKGDLVCDFVSGAAVHNKNKVLDIGSIECDILDEIFEGIRVKKESGELEYGCQGKDNDIMVAKVKDKSSGNSVISESAFFNLVPSSNIEWNENESVMNNEECVEMVVPNEECSETLVESWQYVAGVVEEEGAKGKENHHIEEMMEMAAKPVAQERAIIGCGEDPPAITDHDNSVHGKLPVERAEPFGNMCTPGELDNSTVEGAEFSDLDRSSSPSRESKVEESDEKGFPVSSSSVPENSTTPATPSAAQQDDFILPLPKISTTPSSPLSLTPEKSLVLTQDHLPSTSSSHPSKCPSLPSPLRVNYSHVGPPSLQTSNNVPPPSPSPVEVHLPSPNQTPPSTSLDTSLSSKQNSYLSLSKDTIGSSSQTSPSSSLSSTPSAFSQSPSPSPSTHHHPLSLPPNLAHSPSLSSNQPSLELPEVLTPTPTTSDYFPDTGCERSDDYSWQEVGGATGGQDSWQPHRHNGGYDANSSMEAGATCDSLDESDEDADGARGLAAAVSRVVRRSMRRMRRLRLSGRQSPSRTRSAEGAEGVSEETEVRRDVPAEPSMGLATVRSPAAATIIVTSLVAALAPPPLQGPRELLDPPPQLTPTHNRQTDSNQTDQTNGASRRHPRRQRRPWGGGRDGRRRDGGAGGGEDRRGSYDLPLDSSVSPTAPMSLEVEVGGYSPSAPLSLDYSGNSSTYSPNHHLHHQSIHSAGRSSSISPSAPPSLDLMVPTSENSWIAAAVIPRPSITSSSSHHNHHHPHGRRSHSLPVIQSQPIATPSSSSTTDTPSHSSSNVPPSTSSGSRDEESGPSEGGGVGPRSPRSRSHGVGNGGGGGGGEGEASTSTSTTSAPTRNVADRRRSRTQGNTANDTNNNNSNNNNNNNNTRNYTTTDTTSSTTPPNNNRNRNGNNNTRNNNARQNTRRRPRAASAGLSFEAERLRVQGGTWTHNQSGLMASLAVTVTTFNISRFAVLGAKFGWPFVVQWVVISMVLGLPLMTFHVTVGQYLGAGVVDMWRISPIFQGVGYSLVVAQALVGVYCCVPIAWLFIFFRDSFITHNNMFRWGDCRLVNCSVYNNFSTIIIEGVPKYFSSQVLQRSSVETSWLQELGSIKFDMAVNIALIWVITLIALSRGNQSYGRVAYIVFLLPLLGFLVVCLYLASWTKDDIYINHATNFNELFKTSQSWMAASREVFLVWGFHGSVLQQMSAHNKKGHPLYRDTTVLAVITTLALVLAAVTGSSCVSGLHQNKLYYKPSSFENAESAQFLSETKFQQEIDLSIFKHFPMVNNIPPQLLADYMHYDNFYTGIRIRPRSIGNSKNPEANERSGYQSLRLATELFPALLAVNGAQQISPFWSSLLYFSLLLFGIGQQLAVWRTVIEAVIRINRERLQSWEIFITFLCCLFGFSAALPMATGAGIQILYFLDYVVSCGWWLMIIQLVQIFALLFVRGKPYSGQDIVGELMGKSEQCRSLWLGPLTSFAWNIIVPVGLLVLSISSFKSGQYKDVFAWGNSSYWPVWARQLASALQLFPILLVPLVGLIQICRYLTASDDDLFEKIQLLYRPSLRQRTSGNNSFPTNPDDSDVEGPGSPQEGQEEETVTPRPYSDPPPKYTPPPSYSTATGVRFAKLLNQSLRQSMRRLRDTLRNGSEVNANRDTEGTVQSNNNCNGPEGSTSRRNTPYIPPPDYVTVVGECRTRQNPNRPTTDPPPMYSTLDPLRRRALAAMANATTSTSHVKSDAETEIPRSTTPTLQRNNSVRGSGLHRSIASGVRHSARRLAATFGVGNGEDDSTLVNSEEPLSQDTQPTRDPEESHPHAYTNLEMVSQSEA